MSINSLLVSSVEVGWSIKLNEEPMFAIDDSWDVMALFLRSESKLRTICALHFEHWAFIVSELISKSVLNSNL